MPDWLENERFAKGLKYYLYFFNVISLITAVAIIAFGIWLRWDWDMRQYVYGLHMEQFWYGVYMLIAAASVVLVISALGCVASIKESAGMLGVYAVTLVLCFILELAGTAYLLNHSTLWSDITWWLRDRFYELVYNSDSDPKEARILRIIQEEIGCCGSYSSLDYINAHKPVPNECRDKFTGNEYLDGCYIVVSRYLQEYTGWLGGITLFLIVLQIIGIAACLLLRRAITREDNRGSYGAVSTKVSRA